ncbi:MAG: lipid A deacylase LpxR family protein [Porticoccaceae bacterium]|nr:lipid A deacylase LpxR family protein [Porticoccaceae bacterium]
MKRTLSLSLLLATAGFSTAETADSVNHFISDTPVYSAEADAEHKREPAWDNWALSFDNDILLPGSRDRDYTYGINLVLSGSGAQRAWYSPYKAHAWLDSGFGVDNKSPSDIHRVTLETGVVAFTPDDTDTAAAVEGERPYSSLVYLSSVRQQVDVENNTAWNSSFTVGVLGLPLVGSLQNQLHDVLGGDRANGWNNQISDGGEPTARYAVAKQRYWDFNDNSLEVKTTVQGSLGYLTEASWSVNVRAGDIHSPWWSFNPQLASYGQHSAEIAVSAQRESYFWAGLGLKARAYNAFLQGQFRDSAIRYNSGDVKHLLLEAWAGYTLAFDGGYRVSYMVRGQSSELKQGAGDRNLLWGGLTFTKTF